MKRNTSSHRIETDAEVLYHVPLAFPWLTQLEKVGGWWTYCRYAIGDSRLESSVSDSCCLILKHVFSYLWQSHVLRNPGSFVVFWLTKKLRNNSHHLCLPCCWKYLKMHSVCIYRILMNLVAYLGQVVSAIILNRCSCNSLMVLDVRRDSVECLNHKASWCGSWFAFVFCFLVFDMHSSCICLFLFQGGILDSKMILIN